MSVCFIVHSEVAIFVIHVKRASILRELTSWGMVDSFDHMELGPAQINGN
ncbi:hypothetical protein MGG_16822 [Pyricularia oryzae 70-15]|uniref:Uncharacterized protein n=3 Tax=Pyricularia oryzae TaxID=318829 RepID=G4N2S1_PYRO7|nr:uncharacterized protein MGG_16822 [Pyricularia oryzae 70-15]EHA52576.1 hypothetical protein MGG_16822 [Pyricularia oryzae 70-15]ELQ34791.1 hypothetical protein OOU_Y34scaffold00745g66 [Pyricularia oryzae Y34]